MQLQDVTRCDVVDGGVKLQQCPPIVTLFLVDFQLLFNCVAQGTKKQVYKQNRTLSEFQFMDSLDAEAF